VAESRPETAGGGNVATEIPSRNLAPLTYADLPEPLPMRKVLGPSVLLLAGAIGSGEYVLWPYITSQVGLSLVWLVVIGVGTQYFLNMEIERYTLATGETAVTGFTRLWKAWGPLFIVMTIVPWAWPGWATGGTTTLGFVLGYSEAAVPYITIGVLLLIGVVLTVSPVVYRTVEKIQFFFVGLIVLFMLYALVALLGADGYAALGRGFVEVGRIPDGSRRSAPPPCSARSRSPVPAARSTSSSPTGPATRASAWAPGCRRSSRRSPARRRRHPRSATSSLATRATCGEGEAGGGVPNGSSSWSSSSLAKSGCRPAW